MYARNNCGRAANAKPSTAINLTNAVFIALHFTIHWPNIKLNLRRRVCEFVKCNAHRMFVWAIERMSGLHRSGHCIEHPRFIGSGFNCFFKQLRHIYYCSRRSYRIFHIYSNGIRTYAMKTKPHLRSNRERERECYVVIYARAPSTCQSTF